MSTGKQIKGQALFKQQQLNTNLNGPVIICDGLQTPENFGAILRVADATGCKRILLLDSELDLSNKKLSKLARSTDRHLQIEHCSLEHFIRIKSSFKAIYALEITTKSTDIFNCNIVSCDAIVLGHESKGIRQEVLSHCRSVIHLPMYGINGSMNVSHSLAVFLYEWRRQLYVSET